MRFSLTPHAPFAINYGEDTMFILRNFILTVTTLLDWGLTLYLWIIVIRAVISWVNPDPYNPFVIFLYRVTEPLLAPIRRRLPSLGFGIDLSPLIAVAFIFFLKGFIVKSLIEFTYLLG